MSVPGLFFPKEQGQLSEKRAALLTFLSRSSISSKSQRATANPAHRLVGGCPDEKPPRHQESRTLLDYLPEALR